MSRRDSTPHRSKARALGPLLAGAMMSTLLSVENLRKSFKVSANRPGAPKQTLKAVDGISFTIKQGETLGLVGESGCGKSTAGKLILRLLEADAGTIRFDGSPVTGMPKRELTALRRDMQMIFQDPFSSLNPRMRVGEIIGERQRPPGAGHQPHAQGWPVCRTL